MTVESSYTEDEKKILHVLEEYGKKLNERDYEGWLALWAENGIQMPPGVPLRTNMEEITKTNVILFEDKECDFKLRDIVEVKVDGNIGLTICNFSLYLDNGKKIIEPDGKALTIYEKQSNGEWKIKYDCFNSNRSS